MKAIVLAAGRGKRLVSVAGQTPKCLLRFGDKTLLERIIESLLQNGVEHLVLVVGYKKELVIDVACRYPVQLDVVVNPDYAQTNTIASLYLARHHINDDFLYFNADVLFDYQIVTGLLARDGNAFAIDEKRCTEEEVKVIVDNNRRIVRIGKELVPDQCFGEFIGVGKFSRSSTAAVVEALCKYNEKLNKPDLFFEAAVDDILDEHFFLAMPIDPLCAIEIDTPEDYHQARQIWPKLERS